MLNIKQNVDLKNYTWWKIGGKADYFSEPQSAEELQAILIWANKNKKNYYVLGKGTNVLISDNGVNGLVISTQNFSHMEFFEKENHLKIISGAGVLKSELMLLFQKFKLSPSLFLSGIPGNVGGGVIMNAGVGESCKPKEFSEIVEWVECVTHSGLKRYNKKEITWSYRFTEGLHGVIYRVGLMWSLEKEEDLNIKLKQVMKKRRSTQPLGELSCGSIFKNPYPYFSGNLIEKCGLKGVSCGKAMISQKHGNFIINTGDATAQDVHGLIERIKNEVKQKFDISLETEVRYIGRWV